MSISRFIKNHEVLVANGEQIEVRAYRDLLLRALDAATDAFMPDNALRAHVSVEGQVLHVQGQKWYLPEFEHVYVVGRKSCGKYGGNTGGHFGRYYYRRTGFSAAGKVSYQAYYRGGARLRFQRRTSLAGK